MKNLKLRQVVNRLLTPNLKGIHLIVPYIWDHVKASETDLDIRRSLAGKEMVLTNYAGQYAWLVTPQEYSKPMHSVWIVPAPDMFEWEVSNNTIYIRDGDYVYVDGSAYGLSSNEKALVTHVSEGDATYPVKVEFKSGVCGQYKVSEIYMVVAGGPK